MSAVIHINGFSGVGKLTVAKELAKLMPAARVVDNHSYMDAAFALFTVGSFEWRVLVEDLRRTVYQAAVDVDLKTPLILTNVLYGDRDYVCADTEIFDQVVGIATARKVTFVAVTLTCAPATHRKRLTRRRKPNKLRDWQAMVYLTSMFSMFMPEPGACDHIEIDTTALSATEVAALIHQHVHRWQQVDGSSLDEVNHHGY